MNLLSHIEKSVMGEKVYSSDGEKLYVSFKSFGNPQDHEFLLENISPNYELKYGIFTMAWLIPLMLLAVLLLLIYIAEQLVDLGIFRLVFVMPALAILWKIILGWRTQKIAQFKSGSSSPAFDIILTNKKDHDFVKNLVAVLEQRAVKREQSKGVKRKR